jgi:hypothetical protein
MSLFRSEEHARRWTDAHSYDIGAIVPVEQVWRLARAWYTDPRRSDWRARTRDQSQAVLASVGLTGAFWELPAS